jgi:hypothetical protein
LSVSVATLRTTRPDGKGALDWLLRPVRSMTRPAASPPRRNRSSADSDDLDVTDTATVPTATGHSPIAYTVVSA